MTLSIREILEAQGWRLARESSTAYFYNQVPWVAPLAYLHIVFKGAASDALEALGSRMNLPESWRNVLSAQNGAILFSGAISLYGVHAPGALLDRRDFFNRLPFSIESENRSWPPPDKGAQVSIGGYDYDSTKAVLNLADGTVSAIPRKDTVRIANWPDAETWFASELSRLATLFDSEGKLQVSKELTLPYRIN